VLRVVHRQQLGERIECIVLRVVHRQQLGERIEIGSQVFVCGEQLRQRVEVVGGRRWGWSFRRPARHWHTA